MWPPVDQHTTDGYDLQFGTNVLGTQPFAVNPPMPSLIEIPHAGHFFFTKLLLPALISGSKSSSDGKARIVTTSSGGHYLDDLHWDTLTDEAKRKARGSASLYNQSKYVRPPMPSEDARFHN